MANLRGVEVQDVVQSGPSLAFIAFPEAIAEMKSMGSAVPPLMSFLFFTMLLTLGLDSMFTMVETLTTAILDQFKALKAIKGKLEQISKSLARIDPISFFRVCGDRCLRHRVSMWIEHVHEWGILHVHFD